MVTSKEYKGALETPIPISLFEARYAGTYAEHGTGPHGSMPAITAGKVAELAFWRWLREQDVEPPGTLSHSMYYMCEADRIDVCGRRVEVIADVRPWDEVRALPLRSFGLKVPVEHLRAAVADYYVYCMVDTDYSKVSLIGYYEGYSLLSHEVRTGVVRRCVAVPISWLHPADDLLLILHAGCASEVGEAAR